MQPARPLKSRPRSLTKEISSISHAPSEDIIFIKLRRQALSYTMRSGRCDRQGSAPADSSTELDLEPVQNYGWKYPQEHKPNAQRIGLVESLRVPCLPLLPSRVDGLADQIRRIGSRAWTELLEASGVHFSDVEVAFLVRAHAVHTPERAGEIANSSPRVQQAAVEIVLQHLVGIAIEGHQLPVRADLDEMEARRTDRDLPLGKIFAVLIEDLDAVVLAIVDKHAPSLD